MMLTETTREATTKHSLFSNFFGMFSPKNPHKAKTNQLHVPHALPSLSTTTSTASPARSSTSSEFECVFRYFDEDGDGKISPDELRSCMRGVGEELSAEEAEAVVVSTDSDGDGLLGLEDFVRLVEVEGEEEKGRNLREAFEAYAVKGRDCDCNCNCITTKSLRRALSRLGQSKSVEECEAMIRRFDMDGDGVISFDEFRVMML